MLTVIPINVTTFDRAELQAAWIAKLGGVSAHQCLLVSSRDCPDVEPIRAMLATAFKDVVPLRISDAAGDDIACLNRMFLRSFRFIQSKGAQPFLWMEPTALPLRPRWLNAIALEFAAMPRGRAFLGSYAANPQRMHTVGVWPANTDGLAPAAMFATKNAFNISAGVQIAGRMVESLCIRCEAIHGAALDKTPQELAGVAIYDAPASFSALLRGLNASHDAGTLAPIELNESLDVTQQQAGAPARFKVETVGPVDNSAIRAAGKAGGGNVPDVDPDAVFKASLPAAPPPKAERVASEDTAPVIVRPEEKAPEPPKEQKQPVNYDDVSVTELRAMCRKLLKDGIPLNGLKTSTEVQLAKRAALVAALQA